MNDYKYVDLILGKQCQTKMGRGGIRPLEFKTFSKEMQNAITNYCQAGGNFFVSGAYVASDLWDNRLVKANEEDKKFAMEVLKYKWRGTGCPQRKSEKCSLSIPGNHRKLHLLSRSKPGIICRRVARCS